MGRQVIVWPPLLNHSSIGRRCRGRGQTAPIRGPSLGHCGCCAPLALGVTGYLAVTALRAGDVAGCGGGAVWDCDLALHSRWAKVLSIPVSVPAFGLYAVLLTSLSFCRPTVSAVAVSVWLGDS